MCMVRCTWCVQIYLRPSLEGDVKQSNGVLWLSVDSIFRAAGDGVFQALLTGWELQPQCTILLRLAENEWRPGWYDVIDVLVS